MSVKFPKSQAAAAAAAREWVLVVVAAAQVGKAAPFRQQQSFSTFQPDSSRVTKPGPKISRLRQQNSVLPTLLRSLAPALTPLLLALPLTCGSHVVLGKVCGARNEAPRSGYACICACPATEETVQGRKGYGVKQAGRKGSCSENHLILRGCKLQKIKSDLNSHTGNNEYKLLLTSFGYTKQKIQR